MRTKFWIAYSILVAILIVGNYHEGTRHVSQMAACAAAGFIVGLQVNRRRAK